MSTKWPQGDITPNLPASVLGGSNISGVYTLDQLNRLNADFGPQMQRSLRFRSSASAYLNRTPSVAGNQQKFTFSTWLKRGALGNYIDFFGASNTILSYYNDNTLYMNLRAGATNYVVGFANVFRDPSAWYHIVWAVDTTQATASNRALLYVNGVQLTAASGLGQSWCPQNTNLSINSTIAHYIGTSGGSNYLDGYLAEVNFIDGQALTPSSFGATNATTGVWQPIFYTGAYGTNGFRLTFADNSALTTSSNVGLGKDFSPNGNYWTTNNISLTAGSTYDSMLDVPTNWTSGNPVQSRGNYAVLNPLDKSSYITNSDGNLAISTSYSGAHNLIRSTISLPSSGKFYAEMTFGNTMTGNPAAAFALIAANAGVNTHPASAGNYSVYGSGATQLYSGGTGGASVTGMTTGQVWQFAVDVDGGNAWIGLNNAWYNVYTSGATTGNPSTGTNPTFSGGSFAGMFFGADLVNTSAIINLGQRPFSYTPPSGFKALNTQNLPSPTIFNGAGYMAATTYTGNGSTQSIINAVNGVSFQPDFVWGKLRTTSSYHRLSDSVRGASLTLATNATDAEVSGNGLVSFDATGFSMNSSTNINQVYPYVAWQWKAGGTTVTNSTGTITSQVSANTTAGFSVVTYTGNGTAGATVGHGLGVAPSMVIVKPRVATTTADGWCTGHTSIGWGNFLELNSTNASTTASNRWNNTAPTSSLLTLGSVITDSGKTYVAYCFAAIAGYSAFGSYTGNGSADGPFVYLGFRPRYILIKGSSFVSNWFIEDSSRNGYNVNSGVALRPNLSNAEDGTTTYDLDILSNGFKLRSSSGDSNSSGATFIYACFAENPFKNSLAR